MAKLKCNIMGNVQSYETGILIDGLEREYELIVDEQFVARNNGTNAGQIDVDIVVADDDRDAYLIELPRQVTMGGRRVWVPKKTVEVTD